MSFLELNKVTKVYPNGTKAVHETSMNVEDGEFMVFVGPSGCGKSTLLRQLDIEDKFTNCNIDNFFEPRLIDTLGTKNLHPYSEK